MSAVDTPARIPYRTMVMNDELRAKALEVLETGVSYGGEDTQLFERELAAWCGRRYGVVTNSGTSATMLAMDAIGIGRGDEVIMAANSYVGVLAAVVKLGAIPVFVEAEADSANIRVDAIEAAVTAKTRAIVPLHNYGLPCDMDPINAIAAARGLSVIEDAAHAMGAEYKGRQAGGLGRVGFFSFSGKMITVFGPGGVAITDDRQLAEDISSLRDQGRSRAEEISFIRRRDHRWYDQKWVGYNMHLTEVSAGLGRIQLRMLPEFISKRRENAVYLTRRFTDAGLPVALPAARPWAKPCYLHYVIFTPKRDALRDHLRSRGIETSIHYPAPLHVMEPVMAQYGTRPGQFPVAEQVCRDNLSLPVGPHMTPKMRERLADEVIAFFGQH